MEEKYKPIDCNYYDVLTMYSMHENKLRLEIENELADEPIILKNVLITDIFTKEKVEFAELNKIFVVRLDKLLKVEIVE